MTKAMPGEFLHTALSERLIGYALADKGDSECTQHEGLRKSSNTPSNEPELAINAAVYAFRDSPRDRPALKFFTLNTSLYTTSSNVCGSLTKCHAAHGEMGTAEAFCLNPKALQ